MLEPARTVSIFQRMPEPQTFAAGEVIFKEGETGDIMYGVLEGEVDLIVKGGVFETIHAGDVFGEGVLVQPTRLRASTAIAKTDCKLAVMDKQHFLFAVQETPEFALQIMRSLSNRLRILKAAAM